MGTFEVTLTSRDERRGDVHIVEAQDADEAATTAKGLPGALPVVYSVVQIED